MKKNRVLSRSYLIGYIVSIFGSPLAALLLTKFSNVATVIAAIIAGLAFAALIVSHVFYTHKPKAFVIVSASAFSAIAVLTLLGFTLEVIFTAQGKLSIYPWIIGSICVFLLAVDAPFLIKQYVVFHKTQKKLASAEAE